MPAVIATVIWYRDAPENHFMVGPLCWMYWGASLIWFVDAIFEYAELGAAYFTPAPAELLNDLYSHAYEHHHEHEDIAHIAREQNIPLADAEARVRQQDK